MLAALGTVAALAPRPAEGQSCGVVFGTPINFGTYDPFAPADLQGMGTILHWCTSPPRIWLGTGNAASFTPRAMWRAGSGGAEILQYDLCLDVPCTMVWGDGSGGTHEYVATARFAVVRVYGRVRAGQDPLLGSYSDTVTITVHF